MTRLLAILCITLLAALPASGKDTPQTLLASGALEVSAFMANTGTLVPGQRAELVIEIATPTWFSGGTRIRLPEVPGLVLLQTEQFAANASEVRNGDTWVVQRWSLDLFPQRPGVFKVPPIELRVAVNAGEQGNVDGELFTPEVIFEAAVPPQLEQADFWVASPAFKVKQRLDRDTAALQPGDAFERRITFEADDVQAMMLPDFVTATPAGLAAYPAPPVLENTNNRGQASSSRVEVISYIAQQPGEYQLPAQDFFWWNTESEALEVLTLPAVNVLVEGETSIATLSADSSLTAKSYLGIGTGTLAVLALLWLVCRHRYGRAALSALAAATGKLQRWLHKLRQPALSKRLNPGSNAGE